MIRNLSDIEQATQAVLKAYLEAEGASYSPEALRPELEAKARECFLAKHTEEPELAKTEEKLEPVKEEISAEDALTMLKARGFNTKEEIVSFINVIAREKHDVVREREALAATVADIEQRELKMTEREKAVVKQSEAVLADMKKQEAIYDKLVALKASFPVDTPLNA